MGQRAKAEEQARRLLLQRHLLLLRRERLRRWLPRVRRPLLQAEQAVALPQRLRLRAC